MEQNKSGVGSIIGIIIIIAVIILGGLYFWGKRVEETKIKDSMVTDETGTTTDETAAIKNVGSSDDINSIQSDLQNTKLNNLDSELNQ